MEHVWNMLGRRIAARQLPPTCLPDLRRALFDEWCNIPQDQIDNLILSMPRSFTVGGRLTNTFTKDFCVRISNTFKKDFLCLDNEHIFGGDQGNTPEIMDEILTTARDLELEVNEDDIEELIMGHEDELTIEELQEILNEGRQETLRNMSNSEQEEDERGPMPTSSIKDLLKKGEDVRAMVLEWHPNQADVSRVGDLYNDNAINYFRKILKKREKQSTLDMFFHAP
ncbi:uncharacterized protein TNCV_2112411 [Trichonephila clavipes]|nr:uncharacterized protein TNCV_2112411 [Trichonephila clavipes]